MATFFIFFQMICIAVGMGKDTTSMQIQLHFRLCSSHKQIQVPIFDREQQFILFKLHKDTIICDIKPIVKKMRENTNSFYEEGLLVILSKKNKTITQTISDSIFLENKDKFNFIVFNHKNDRFVFERDKTGIDLFIMKQHQSINSTIQQNKKKSN